MNGEETERLVDIPELVDRASSSWKGWPFVETCRDGGVAEGDPRPISPKLGVWEGVTNPPTKPPSSDSSTRGGRGGESMPCMEGFRLEVMVLPREEPDARPASRLFRWRLFCELVVSRREERTDDRLSWREWPLAFDRCFCSDTIFRYTVCLPRRPCSKFVMIFRTSGK